MADLRSGIVAKPLEAPTPEKGKATTTKKAKKPRSGLKPPEAAHPANLPKGGNKDKTTMKKKKKDKKAKKDDRMVVDGEKKQKQATSKAVEDKPASTKTPSASKRKREEEAHTGASSGAATAKKKKGKEEKGEEEELEEDDSDSNAAVENADEDEENEDEVNEDEENGAVVVEERTAPRKRQRLFMEVAESPNPASLPSLACFPNAPPPLSSLHNGENGLRFGVWQHKGIVRTKKMLVAETDKMLYLGQPIPRNPSSYYVMAVDRVTHKATLIPVDNFYNMQQQIKGYTPQLPTDAEDDDRTFAEQKRALVDRFGSKKSRTINNSTLANRIVTGRVSHADDIMSTLGEKAAQQATEDKPTTMYPELPLYNAHTGEVADVYSVSDIIPSDLLGQIDASLLLGPITDASKLASRTKKYGSYIANRVAELQGLLPGIRERHARLMALVGGLMKLRSFIRSERGSFSLIEAKEGTGGVLPEDVLLHFLPLFTDANGRRFRNSPLGQVRLINYILILLLHISEWRLDASAVSGALEMEYKKCQNHLLSIGCKLSKAKKKVDDPDDPDALATTATRLFVLRAPLVLPDKTRVRGGGKKK